MMRILLLTLLLASNALAAPFQIDVDLVWVPGSFAVTPPERRAILKEARRYLRKLPYDITFRSRTTTDQSCNGTLNADNPDFVDDTLTCYGSYPHRKNKLTVFMTPPLYTSDGRRGVAGVAEGVCRLFEAVAVCYVQAENHLGVPRLQESGACLAHELGHLFGAGHTVKNRRSIMDIAPLTRVPKLKFLGQSIQEILDCRQFTYEDR